MDKKVLNYVGVSETLTKTEEECAELIKACAKYRDVMYPRKNEYPPSKKYTKQLVTSNLKEEMAHVLNCIESLMYLLHIDEKELDLIKDSSSKCMRSRIEETTTSSVQDIFLNVAHDIENKTLNGKEDPVSDILKNKAGEIHDLLMKLDDCLLWIKDGKPNNLNLDE